MLPVFEGVLGGIEIPESSLAICLCQLTLPYEVVCDLDVRRGLDRILEREDLKGAYLLVSMVRVAA